jgi:superoxide dismutase, Fe-Mn family
MISRRQMLQASAAVVLLPTAASAQPAAGAGFTLPKLPYAYDALEPHIDAETMQIHHTKHHQTYVTNLNDLLAKNAPQMLGKSIEEVLANLKAIPEGPARTGVRNNGGGHWNHTFFWNVMTKTPAAPKGELLKAIDDSFGSLDKFKTEFNAEATKRFGSGWAWVITGTRNGKPLAIVSTPNQDNPLMDGGAAPILGVDVWEHAYYLKYRNLRAKYLEAFHNVVNWDVVAEHYAKSKK